MTTFIRFVVIARSTEEPPESRREAPRAELGLVVLGLPRRVRLLVALRLESEDRSEDAVGDAGDPLLAALATGDEVELLVAELLVLHGLRGALLELRLDLRDGEGVAVLRADLHERAVELLALHLLTGGIELLLDRIVPLHE